MDFIEKHKDQAEQLGFQQDDVDSRNMFYNEIFTNPEIKLPEAYTLPEKAEDWLFWELPDQVYKESKKHEDKTMIAKWAF